MPAITKFPFSRVDLSYKAGVEVVVIFCGVYERASQVQRESILLTVVKVMLFAEEENLVADECLIDRSGAIRGQVCAQFDPVHDTADPP